MRIRGIPHREPEVIQAEADRRWHGDPDKVPTTSLRSPLLVDGITIISRYNNAHEFELMIEMVWSLSPLCRALLKSIFRDSKCGTLTVELRNWNEDVARIIGERLDYVLVDIDGGHSGLWMTSPSKEGFGGDKFVEFEGRWDDIA
jgi:hypothetical protein